MTPILYLMCGLTEAGKKTYAKQLEIRLPAFRLTPDEWMGALSIETNEKWLYSYRCKKASISQHLTLPTL